MKQKTFYLLLIAVLFLALAVAGPYARSPQPIKEKPVPVSSNIAPAVRPVLKTSEVTPVETASTESADNVRIDWQVLSSGGTEGSSTLFKLNGTLCQIAIGEGTTTNFKLSAGFWQNFGTGSCCDKPGDANNNGAVQITDVSFVINFLYKHGPTPPCRSEADANGNNAIQITDVSYIINFLYKHGPTPICGHID